MDDLLQKTVQEWLEAVNLQSVLYTAVKHMQWATRGPLRLYVPATELENGTIPQTSFAEALQKIQVESLHPSQATVTTGLYPVGIYAYTEGEDTEVAEVTYLDELGNTVIKTTADDAQPVTMELGGRLPIFEMRRELLINDSLRRLQKKLNHAATAEQANLTTAGWITRLFFNAQMPGDFEYDSNGNIVNDPITGQPKFTPEVVTFGPEVVNFIAGIQTVDSDGNEKYLNPQYVREEPVQPDTFLKTIASTKQAMLHLGRQAHVKLAVEAQASGESRLQARGDYENSLTLTAPQVERAFVWAVETAVSMAAFFSNEASPLETMRVTAQCQLDLGVITPKEKATALSLWDKKLISRRTALRWCGIDNPDAEIEQIKQEAAMMQETAVSGNGDAGNGETAQDGQE
jgi:hypothetical protein